MPAEPQPADSQPRAAMPPDGPRVERDQAGTLRSQATLEQGVLHGPLTLFDEHGRPTLEEHYRHGKLEGVRRIFVNGRLHTLATYRDGLQHGETLLHHAATGAVAAKLPYHAGRLHGEAQYFDQDGRLAKRSIYYAGSLHGDSTFYYPDGAVLAIEPYHRGLLHGEVKWFSTGGAVDKRALFANGKPVNPVPPPAAQKPPAAQQPSPQARPR